MNTIMNLTFTAERKSMTTGGGIMPSIRRKVVWE